MGAPTFTSQVKLYHPPFTTSKLRDLSAIPHGSTSGSCSRVPAVVSGKYSAIFLMRSFPKHERSSRRIRLNVFGVCSAVWIAGRDPYSSSNFFAILSETDGTHINIRVQQTFLSQPRSLLKTEGTEGGVSAEGGIPGSNSPFSTRCRMTAAVSNRSTVLITPCAALR